MSPLLFIQPTVRFFPFPVFLEHRVRVALLRSCQYGEHTIVCASAGVRMGITVEFILRCTEPAEVRLPKYGARFCGCCSCAYYRSGVCGSGSVPTSNRQLRVHLAMGIAKCMQYTHCCLLCIVERNGWLLQSGVQW